MRIKDWTSFQHYKNRRPPWIRLYGNLLDDPEWFALEGRASWVLASLWLIAREDETRGGNLPAINKLAFRLRMSSNVLADYIRQLNHWVEFNDSELLASCLQHATPDTDTSDNSETDNSEAERVPRPTAPDKEFSEKYAFDGTVIRLTEKGLDDWKKAFSKVDLIAELTARDAWLASDEGARSRDKWFASTSAYLRNKNERAPSKSKIRSADDPYFGVDCS